MYNYWFPSTGYEGLINSNQERVNFWFDVEVPLAFDLIIAQLITCADNKSDFDAWRQNNRLQSAVWLHVRRAAIKYYKSNPLLTRPQYSNFIPRSASRTHTPRAKAPAERAKIHFHYYGFACRPHVWFVWLLIHCVLSVFIHRRIERGAACALTKGFLSQAAYSYNNNMCVLARRIIAAGAPTPYAPPHLNNLRRKYYGCWLNALCTN